MTAVVVEVVPRQSAAKRRQHNHAHRRGRVGDGGMFTGRTGVKAAWFHEIQGRGLKFHCMKFHRAISAHLYSKRATSAWIAADVLSAILVALPP